MLTGNTAKSNIFNLKRILVILMIAIVLIISIIVSISIACRPYDKTNNQYKIIDIKENYTIDDVATSLKKKGIIGSKDKFIKLTHLLVHGKSFQAGIYYLSPSMNFQEIAVAMIDGITTSEGFVLPEGYTVEQTAEAMEQTGYCSRKEFLEAASEIDFSSYDFIDKSISGPEKLEGFLLPVKYTISNEVNAAMIIMNMLNEFDNAYTDEYRARTEELGMSIRDIVIIASIIEKETSIEKEKALISSVIHNKLNMNVKFSNGYPTSPLCSPSLSSIKAALYPEEREDIYYILSEKLDGTHVFTSDKKEYQELKAAYKQAVKEKNAKLEESED